MFVVLHLGECNVVLCVSLIQLCTNDRPIILTILLYSHIVLIFCLRSRPGTPKVVLQLVSQLVRGNVERKTESDQVTE